MAESVSCHFISDVANGRSAAQQARSPHPRPQLRKTFSDLGGVLQGRCCLAPTGHAENPRAVYASPSCNGPKEDPAFSPAWSASSFGYVSPSASQGELAGDNRAPLLPCSPRQTPDSDQPTSFFIDKEQAVRSNGNGMFCASPKSPTEAGGGSKSGAREAKASLVSIHVGEGDGPASEKDRAVCRFRERSLSVPTDTVSLCSVDMGGSETCGLSYPSASSEGSTSTDNISLAVEQDAQAKQRRLRTKSISLKKAKRKPCPPVRSVSLIKEEQGSKAELGIEAASQDQRPRSLCLLPEGHVHSQDHEEAPQGLEGVPYTQQWYMPEWASGEPYCSLSGSSTATGATMTELAKAPRGSSESLPSPSISRATTPSQFSAEVYLKTCSPGRPAGVMSPSSGYSSQSETPTPTVPTSVVLGHPPAGRTRPLVPERKSSLPPLSPMERSPMSQLSFDLPFAPPAHLDLSALKICRKGKAKVSRHHSDSTFGAKLGPKLSPVQSVMPMVTQLDLRSVRLRSVSRSETEDALESPGPTEEPGKKVRPPVAEKPPLSRRPPMLLHKTPPVQEEDSPPGSPTSPGTPQGGVPAENIYTVGRRPEPRWDTEAWSPVASPSPVGAASPAQPSPGAFFCPVRRLSEESLEEEEERKSTLPAERTPSREDRQAKVPPPVPKKPSVLYLPLVASPLHPAASRGDSRLATSPLVMLDEDSAYPELAACKVPSPRALEGNDSPAEVSWGDIPGKQLYLQGSPWVPSCLKVVEGVGHCARRGIALGMPQGSGFKPY